MNAFLTQEDFISLVAGDKLYGHGTTVEIETANCGSSGQFPTHRISTIMNGEKDYDYIFHDGENIRYSVEDDKERDGAIVGNLIDDGNCRVIKKTESIKNSIRNRNRSLIGTGKFCPDCGGLCSNSNHTRQRW